MSHCYHVSDVRMTSKNNADGTGINVIFESLRMGHFCFQTSGTFISNLVENSGMDKHGGVIEQGKGGIQGFWTYKAKIKSTKERKGGPFLLGTWNSELGFFMFFYIPDERKQSETYKKMDCDRKAIPLPEFTYIRVSVWNAFHPLKRRSCKRGNREGY